MLQVQLKTGLKDSKLVYLRPLSGHDEAFVSGNSSIEATQFLDRLLVSTDGNGVSAGTAKKLTICDQDRIFSALYLKNFGDQIESNITCQSCGQPFELSFSLSKLIASLDRVTTTKATGPDQEGIYTLTDGRKFRLPTVGDRNSLMGLTPEQAMTRLLELCVVEGDPTQNAEELEAAMEEVGALLDLDLDASCPECGNAQKARFDIQSYLFKVLSYEQRFLSREIHVIARTYGWGYQEILNLTRQERRTFVRLIEAEPALGRRLR